MIRRSDSSAAAVAAKSSLRYVLGPSKTSVLNPEKPEETDKSDRPFVRTAIGPSAKQRFSAVSSVLVSRQSGIIIATRYLNPCSCGRSHKNGRCPLPLVQRPAARSRSSLMACVLLSGPERLGCIFVALVAIVGRARQVDSRIAIGCAGSHNVPCFTHYTRSGGGKLRARRLFTSSPTRWRQRDSQPAGRTFVRPARRPVFPD
jgi:hypothetical protein